MHVVLCAGWYLPESIGGTELYVQSLADELRAAGSTVTIMAPIDGEHARSYEHRGVPVLRYPVPEERSPEQHGGLLPHSAFERFEQMLRDTRAQVFHLHSVTFGCNAHHVRMARALGMRTLTTLHVPGSVCARGTMMRFGAEACDGEMIAGRCAPCWAHAQGLPADVVSALAPLWVRLGPRAAAATSGRLRTLLAAPQRVEDARASLHALCDASDAIVVVCDWLRSALIANGISPERIVSCRQGVERRGAAQRGPRAQAVASGARLRVGFFGRASVVKGLDTLVDAVRALPPELAIELGVHAPCNDAESREYLARVRRLAGGDPRIRFEDAVQPERVMDRMRDYDLIAVPSRWLETGPLSAMEALAAGVPVLGSDLGGIAELVEEGVTGWLVPHDQPLRWRDWLEALCREPERARLRWAPERVALPTPQEVARRMLALYAAPP